MGKFKVQGYGAWLREDPLDEYSENDYRNILPACMRFTLYRNIMALPHSIIAKCASQRRKSSGTELPWVGGTLPEDPLCALLDEN